jgi:cytoskeletal protein CcmA (bactofilin family)
MNDKKPFRFQRLLKLIKFKRIGLFLAAVFLLPFLLIFSPTPSWSGEMAAQKSITIGTKEVINDDLYLAADKITIDGIVKGDAVLAASEITLNGTVEGDLIAAGRVITVNGTVKDDSRIAGAILILGEAARVNDDMMAAGYSLENKSGSTIGGNLLYFGGQGVLAGSVQQNIRGAAAALQIAGTVKGNVNVTVGNHELSRPFFIPEGQTIPNIPAGLTLTETARLGGELAYRSAAEATLAPGATVSGRMTRDALPADTLPSSNTANTVLTLLFQVQRWISLGLVGWLLLRFAPGWMQALGSTLQARPLPSLGWGIVTEAVVIVAAIALCILTVVLLMISGVILPSLALPIFGIGLLSFFSLLIGFIIFASFVPPIALSFLGGQWLMAKLQPDRPRTNLMALVTGLAVFVILTAIPGVGPVVNAIVILLGLGAIWLWWKGDRPRATSSLPAPVS